MSTDEHGGGTLEGEDEFALQEPLLAEVYNASIAGRLALGENAGHWVLRFGPQTLPRIEGASSTLPRVYGFNVHANVCATDDRSRYRLCRYLVRPPLSNERVQWVGENQVRVKLKRSWSNGITHLHFTPQELVERLTALIPPPRMNLVRYHGLFASNHKFRAQVVPAIEQEAEDVSASSTSSNREPDTGCGHRQA